MISQASPVGLSHEDIERFGVDPLVTFKTNLATVNVR